MENRPFPSHNRNIVNIGRAEDETKSNATEPTHSNYPKILANENVESFINTRQELEYNANEIMHRFSLICNLKLLKISLAKTQFLFGGIRLVNNLEFFY